MQRLLAATAALVLTPALAFASEINLNTADAAALDRLEGVGPVKAEAIVEYREANGPFGRVHDLTEVSGIGAATVEANRDRITVGE